jgi:hypothetical protein
MTKEQILSEIRRTALANGGVPLGWKRFKTETGIGYYDWYGKFGSAWSDLTREAGFDPHRFNTDRYTDDDLVQALVSLSRRVGRVPARGDIIFAKRTDEAFPSEKAFRRLGPYASRVSRITDFCRRRPEYNDVLPLWETTMAEVRPNAATDGPHDSTSAKGYVYLLKHGSRSEYKIGRTFSPMRREGEIAIELPEKPAPIHYIETDDPSGVETYWHNRFATKRKQGEWFTLSPDDVRAFRRWKKIY